MSRPCLLIKASSQIYIQYDPNYVNKEYMNFHRQENKTQKVTLGVFEWWDFGEFNFLYFYSSVFSKFFTMCVE